MIIKEYADKYPDLIKPIYQKENLWNKEESASKDYIYPMIQGEYVALCEGDDYWTDPLKLQKQVDFLDAHPDYSICFHPVLVHWEDNSVPDTYYPTRKQLKKIKKLNLKNLLKQNFIQTNSVVYRWRFHNESADLIPTGILPGDWFLHLIHAQVGKIGFLPEVMATYRRHSNGIWTGAGMEDTWFIRCGMHYIKFNEIVASKFHVSRRKEIKKLFIQTYNAALNLSNQDLINQLRETYPQMSDCIKKQRFVSFKINIYSLTNKFTANIFSKSFNRKIDRLKMIKNIQNSL